MIDKYANNKYINNQEEINSRSVNFCQICQTALTVQEEEINGSYCDECLICCQDYEPVNNESYVEKCIVCDKTLEDVDNKDILFNVYNNMNDDELLTLERYTTCNYCLKKIENK